MKISDLIVAVLGRESDELAIVRAAEEHAVSFYVAGGALAVSDSEAGCIQATADTVTLESGRDIDGLHELEKALSAYPRAKGLPAAVDLATELYTPRLRAAYVIGLIAGWNLAEQIGGAR